MVRAIRLTDGVFCVQLALRVTDAAARSVLDATGKIPVFISLKGSFHGRTDRAAAVSHATHGLYTDELASFQESRLGERGSTKGRLTSTTLSESRRKERRTIW